MFWNKKENEEKVFVVINSYFIGDILLVNPLIQNIKRLYPESKVVMVTSESLQDIAKYQEGVDNVVVWDRKGNDKGVNGMFKFLKRIPYKKVYAAIPIYGLDRPLVLSAMTGAKYVLAQKRENLFYSIFRRSKYPIEYNYKTIQELHISLLTGITKEKLENVPMVYNVPETEDRFNLTKPYIVLNPTGTRETKCIPLEVVLEIVNKSDKHFVLLGKGEIIKKYSQALSGQKRDNITDLSDKTTMLEAAQIIKNANGMISADTGFMHMACAVGTPVVVPFYETSTAWFQPSEEIYKAKVLCENQTANNIISALETLVNL